MARDTEQKALTGANAQLEALRVENVELKGQLQRQAAEAQNPFRIAVVSKVGRMRVTISALM